MPRISCILAPRIRKNRFIPFRPCLCVHDLEEYFPVIWKSDMTARLAWLILILLIAPSVAGAQTRTDTEQQFQQWLRHDLWPDAQRAGVSKTRFREAIRGLTLNWSLPDLVPPGTTPPVHREQSQAEFRGPAIYFSERRLQSQTRSGKALAARWRETLEKIERQYGVPGPILLAIWARESAFGRASIPHSTLRVLATKAFMSTRKELFRKEMLAALQIIERGDIAPNAMKSSWAGAMGQPQFLPSSYLEFAVDFNGDGRADIWDSAPDTLASIANYLARNGWQPGRDWGFEVKIPTNVSCAQEGPDRARPIADWIALGIARVSGRPFPAHEVNRTGMLLVPAGRNGPHFIVTPNFYVLKTYNNSDLYALYVGNLADRIAYNMGAFHTPWAPQAKMLRSSIAVMQRALEQQGHDVGGADGLPGFKTRRSIGAWQEQQGRQSTCFPTPKLIGEIG